MMNIEVRQLPVAVLLLAVLGASAAIGVLLELIDPVLLEVDEVESLTGMMALGEVPRAS